MTHVDEAYDDYYDRSRMRTGKSCMMYVRDTDPDGIFHIWSVREVLALTQYPLQHYYTCFTLFLIPDRLAFFRILASGSSLGTGWLSTRARICIHSLSTWTLEFFGFG